MRHTHRKQASALVRQPSLQHKCKADVLLISPSLYWPLQEQLWVQIKDTFPIHMQSNLIKWSSTYRRIAAKNTLCIDHILPNEEEMACWGERQVLEMMASSSVRAWLQDEKHETGKRSVVCSLVLPLIATVVTSAVRMPDSSFRGNPSALHKSHRGLLYFKCNTDSRCSAVRLATTSWRSALKVKKCSVDHTQNFTRIPNPHIYTNLIRS